VAPWRGDATAAYSLIHDDVCDPAALGVFSVADPELARRNLHAGFGVIAGLCDSPRGGRWSQVQTLVSHGHDVFSHSFTHPCMTNDPALAESCDPAAPRSVDFAKQVAQSVAALQSHTGLAQRFFIFPYDVCDPRGIAALKRAGVLAARCGTPGINPPGFSDPFAIQFDVFGPSYSRSFGSPACARTRSGAPAKQYTTKPADYTAACRHQVLDGYVDDAIASGGWAVRELHGLDPVDPQGWETVSVSDYRAHLDYLRTRADAGALWVEGPTTITRYRFARDPAVCAPPQLNGSWLRFPAPTPLCRTWATTLSFRVSTSDGSDRPALRVRQGDRILPARRLGPGRFVIDADPTGGDAELQ
jgi:hypothetical protein